MSKDRKPLLFLMVVLFVYSSAFCKQEKGKRAGYSAAQPFLVSSRNAPRERCVA